MSNKNVSIQDVYKAIEDKRPREEIIALMDSLKGYKHFTIIPDERYIVDGRLLIAFLDIMASSFKKKRKYKFW